MAWLRAAAQQVQREPKPQLTKLAPVLMPPAVKCAEDALPSLREAAMAFMVAFAARVSSHSLLKRHLAASARAGKPTTGSLMGCKPHELRENPLHHADGRPGGAGALHRQDGRGQEEAPGGDEARRAGGRGRARAAGGRTRRAAGGGGGGAPQPRPRGGACARLAGRQRGGGGAGGGAPRGRRRRRGGAQGRGGRWQRQRSRAQEGGRGVQRWRRRRRQGARCARRDMCARSHSLRPLAAHARVLGGLQTPRTRLPCRAAR